MRYKLKKTFLNFKLCSIAMLCCSLTIGCSTTVPAQRSINLINQQNSSINIGSQTQKKLKKNNCHIKIHKVIDDRSDKNNIGVFCGSEIITKDLSDWINRFFVVLENTSKALNGNEILLNISIKKMYIKNISTSKTATIVLQVDYLKGTNIILSKLYRKQITKINWNCTEHEIIELLNNVLQDIMTDIINDISNLPIN